MPRSVGGVAVALAAPVAEGAGQGGDEGAHAEGQQAGHARKGTLRKEQQGVAPGRDLIRLGDQRLGLYQYDTAL